MFLVCFLFIFYQTFSSITRWRKKQVRSSLFDTSGSCRGGVFSHLAPPRPKSRQQKKNLAWCTVNNPSVTITPHTLSISKAMRGQRSNY